MSDKNWNPTKIILRTTDVTTTSTQVFGAMTDAGPAFIKSLGNNAGPHALAREFIGTSLAKMIGLPTLEFKILHLSDGVCDEVGFHAKPGPCFATKAENIRAWDGTEDDLEGADNRHVVAGLVVFDTWSLNKDRFYGNEKRLENVSFLSESPTRKLRKLIAMDHSHCWWPPTDLGAKTFEYSNQRSESVYGMFPEFQKFIDLKLVDEFINRTARMTRESIGGLMHQIPHEWDVSESLRKRWVDFCFERGQFMRHFLREQIAGLCGNRQLGLRFG